MGKHYEAVEPTQFFYQRPHPVTSKEPFHPVAVSRFEVAVVSPVHVEFTHFLAAVLDAAEKIDFPTQQAHCDIRTQFHETSSKLTSVFALFA